MPEQDLSALKEQIFQVYTRTPEGRSKLSNAFLYPTRQRLEFREMNTRMLDLSMSLEGTDIALGERILATVPEEERSADEVFSKLQSLLDELRRLKAHLQTLA
jgi:non-ribosomal peptide synthetase component E (peptide arylation enzyme)